MIKIFKYLCFSAVLFSGITSTTVQAQKIYNFEIKEDIAKPALRKTQKAVKEAESENADFLVLHLNTFGGELSAADEIRTLLLNTPVKTVVFIDPNAASAGALISIACDSIFMAPGSSIGAASVVNQNGEIMPDKYQSYMRSLMRSTAEKQGRNPDIAQAMVDPDVFIKGIIDSGKVLTFTAKEALVNDFCDGIYEDINTVYEHLAPQPTMIYQQSSWLDKLIYFLIHPAVSGILIMLIIGGIYFELQTPGIGFPIIVAATAAVLYFAPLYLEGLAAHWEIVLFFVGLLLVGIEIFALPGFGVTGISGITLIIVALVLSLVKNDGFDFSFTPPVLMLNRFFLVIIFSGVGFFASVWLGKKLLTAQTPWGRLALDTEQRAEDGYTVLDKQLQSLIGKTGESISFMRPTGKILIDNELYDAIAYSGVIEKGDCVKVVKYENTQIFVEKV